MPASFLMRPAFTKANSHLFDRNIWAWNLPAGHSCPAALECLTKADKDTGKIDNGPHQAFRCYAAVTERFPSVRSRAWANFDAVRGKSAKQIYDVLAEALPQKAKIVRIHSGGDFFNQSYFDGWVMLATEKPDVLFYAYTKSVNYWVKRKGSIPPNMVLQASYGGRFDDLIGRHELKYARVVWSVGEAEALGLEIDIDDRLAAHQSASFALMENFSQAKKEMIAGRL